MNARVLLQGGYVCISLLLLSACSFGTTTTSAPPPLGRVSMRLTSDWGTLNPAKSLQASAFQIEASAYDRLVALGPGSKILPYLATSWTQTPGSITFALRTDAKCSDGTPVTATVVADSINYLFAPSTNSPALRLFGPRPYSASAVDSSHVTVKVSSNITDLLTPFISPADSIVCPAGLLPGADFTKHSYGSGPYTLDSANEPISATLTLRPDWKWGPQGSTASGLPTTLFYQVVTNETTAANLVLTGGLNIAQVSGPDVARLSANKSLTHLVAYPPVATLMIFNESAGRPTADEAVRKAFSAAVDRTAWNQAANGGHGVVATSLLAAQVNCYSPQTAQLLPSPSIASAKTILTADGYVAGADGKLSKDGKPLTITVVGNTGQNAGPEYVSNQLAALGVNANLTLTDRATASNDWTKGAFDVILVDIRSHEPTLSTAIDFYTGSNPPPVGLDWSRIFDPAADQAVKAARTTVGAESCSNWDMAVRALLSNHDLLPLAFPAADFFSTQISFLPDTIFVRVDTFKRTAA
jgi:peptide/nickel transport system substrate-binding protein